MIVVLDVRMPFDLNGKVYGVNNQSALYEKNGKQPTTLLGFRHRGRRKSQSALGGGRGSGVKKQRIFVCELRVAIGAGKIALF